MRRNIFHWTLIAIVFGLFINFSISDVYADPPVVGYTTQQMTINGTQTLTASGGSGGPYTWSVIGGSGSLSSPTGDSVTYTAPPSNRDCVNSPNIRMTDSSGQSADLQIAVNAYTTYSPVAYWVNECQSEWSCNYSGCGTLCATAMVAVQGYRCDGSYAGAISGCANGGNCCWHSGSPGHYCTCDECFAVEFPPRGVCTGIYRTLEDMKTCASLSLVCCGAVEHRFPLDVPDDKRTQGFKDSGCCPAPFPSVTGIHPEDKGNSCDIAAPVGSSANVKSGNLYDSLQVATLTFSYNTVDPYSGLYNGPVGKKWTHSYNLKITPLSGDNNTVVLKTEDGKDIYFTSPMPATWQNRTALLFLRLAYHNLRRLLKETLHSRHPERRQPRLPSLSQRSLTLPDLEYSCGTFDTHDSPPVSPHMSPYLRDSFRGNPALSDFNSIRPPSERPNVPTGEPANILSHLSQYFRDSFRENPALSDFNSSLPPSERANVPTCEPANFISPFIPSSIAVPKRLSSSHDLTISLNRAIISLPDTSYNGVLNEEKCGYDLNPFAFN